MQGSQHSRFPQCLPKSGNRSISSAQTKILHRDCKSSFPLILYLFFSMYMRYANRLIRFYQLLLHHVLTILLQPPRPPSPHLDNSLHTLFLSQNYQVQCRFHLPPQKHGPLGIWDFKTLVLMSIPGSCAFVCMQSSLDESGGTSCSFCLHLPTNPISPFTPSVLLKTQLSVVPSPLRNLWFSDISDTSSDPAQLLTLSRRLFLFLVRAHWCWHLWKAGLAPLDLVMVSLIAFVDDVI